MTTSEIQWPTLSIRAEVAEFWDGWPEVVARIRARGFLRVMPGLVMSVLVTIGMVFLLFFVKIYRISRFVWWRIVPWGPYHRARRERKRRDDDFSSRFLKPAAKRTSRCPLTRPPSRAATSGLPTKTKDLFFRLPAEIRYSIQLFAFGHRTVHMDLRFERPLVLADEKPYPSWAIHARIHSNSLSTDSHLDHSQEMAWRWFSCICHRYPPDGTHLPLGRRRNYPWGHFREPDVDFCLVGSGLCNEWPGVWPKNCQIGIMGWILSCRDAYVEGTNILYSTNTIHIASPALLRSLQDVIPEQRVSELTSLELVWHPKELPLNLAFTTLRKRDSPPGSASTEPVFPALVYLRITFKRLTYGETDETVGLIWPYTSKTLLADKLHNHLLPTIDRLLDRIVPPSTEVTISCSKWDWYEQIDLALVEKQGKEITKPERADIEGLRCWREIPRSQQNLNATTLTAGSPDGIQEGGSEVEGLRKGYWIHMPIDEVHLDRGMHYDWHRHELYNLGEKRYRYC
ncbi:hypothetical protein B0J13DRAFT_538866 [Dactylonectria estremocensis]|uniref:DUF7730 domain-containing protein n=1 Tax=Dactylonectria estremocensis TaxID=1079267 RepID=A0A9P9FLC0_9HYPO|nr:hypothetical protein B0J13DRAFT_538866 [Dactylonectria estremocensis]